jgi:protein-tyrosine phosphatase
MKKHTFKNVMYCTICAKPQSLKTCGVCELRIYCGDACADADWATHRIEEHCPEGVNTADMVLSGDKKNPGDIYVGGIEALSDVSIMQKVGAVVSCIHASVDELGLMRRKIGRRAHFIVPVWDHADEPIEQYWPAAADFIEHHISMGHSVLVHCHAGMSRSVSTVLYYMMHKRGFATADAALEVVKLARCVAQPNEGFMQKLRMKF